MGSEIAHWRQTVVSAPGEEQITPEGVSEGDDVQLGDRSGQKLVKQRPGGGGGGQGYYAGARVASRLWNKRFHSFIWPGLPSDLIGSRCHGGKGFTTLCSLDDQQQNESNVVTRADSWVSVDTSWDHGDMGVQAGRQECRALISYRVVQSTFEDHSAHFDNYKPCSFDNYRPVPAVGTESHE